PQLAPAGHGIDRHIQIAPITMFDTTFRNPGSAVIPQRVDINNVGEAPLQVSSVAIQGAPIWTLADPDQPFVVPGRGVHSVMVDFAPAQAGKAPDGILAVTSDDRNAAMGITRVTLVGNGKDRNVELAPSSIDVGDTG